VVFATRATGSTDVVAQVQAGDAAHVIAAAALTRGDLSRVGIVGHSMGGGATSYLAQQAVAHGWGTNALWLMLLAPTGAAGVGDGVITLPGHARVQVVNFDDDVFVDTRIGIEIFHAFTVAFDHKDHILVRSDEHKGAKLDATHTAPN